MSRLAEAFEDQVTETAARVLQFTHLKVCPCGRALWRPEWRTLPFLGIQEVGGGWWLECRQCPTCANAITRELHTELDWTELSSVLNEALCPQAEAARMSIDAARRIVFGNCPDAQLKGSSDE